MTLKAEIGRDPSERGTPRAPEPVSSHEEEH
jgi:hypothetical protein